MRFEHIIEINAPHTELGGIMAQPFTREQLWRGIMAKVLTPERFPLGPEKCEHVVREPGVIDRTLQFGPHTLQDTVQVTEGESLVFVPEPHADTTPIQLTLRIEEPAPGYMVLRFIYEALAPQTDEDRYYNEYRHNAWLHNDRDMVKTLRQWLLEDGL